MSENVISDLEIYIDTSANKDEEWVFGTETRPAADTTWELLVDSRQGGLVPNSLFINDGDDVFTDVPAAGYNTPREVIQGVSRKTFGFSVNRLTKELMNTLRGLTPDPSTGIVQITSDLNTAPEFRILIWSPEYQRVVDKCNRISPARLPINQTEPSVLELEFIALPKENNRYVALEWRA